MSHVRLALPSLLAVALTLLPGCQSLELKHALATAFPENLSLEEPGYILSITVGGQLIFERHTGAADIEQGIPISATSVFHAASLSKQITAAALVQALQDGLVSLDDPVAKWIPATAKYGPNLTIAHLAYMTSGLIEYTDRPAPGGRPWSTFHYFTTADAIAASLAADTLAFAPGREWRYSNTNYMLLAQIVEEAYGEPFSHVVRDKVFQPLGMRHSLINDDVTTLIKGRANAYLPRTNEALRQLSAGGGIDVDDNGGLIMIRRNAPHYGGSGVMTSMRDWLRWQNALLTESVFGPEFWSLMKQRREFDHGKNNDALGLVHGRFGKAATLWYAGGDIDTSAYSIAVPDQSMIIACFANNPLASCEQTVRRALAVVGEYGTAESR